MKDILVHIDDSERCATRVDVATGLARRFEARLTGLFARVETNPVSAVARRPSESWLQAAAAAKDEFNRQAGAAGVPTRWWQLAHGAVDHVRDETIFCARYTHLTIMGQHRPDNRLLPETLIEDLVEESGRPVLVVPHSGSFPTVGERVVVAWNGSREATRALHDALPLLIAAKEVTVISLQDAGSAGQPSGNVPPVNILDHLASYGIDPHGERLAGDNIGKMDMLLSRACDLGADLLVMGGRIPHGLSLSRASGTRHILREMTLPVLLAD